MTKKHFIALAAMVAELRVEFPGNDALLDDVAHRLANISADTNPNFDYARFKKAAGCK